MYGSDSKADHFEIWIDSQYPFSDTDHNQASSVNSSVWGTFKIKPKNMFSWVGLIIKVQQKYKRLEKIYNPKMVCESFHNWGFWSHSKANDLCHLYVWLAVFDS